MPVWKVCIRPDPEAPDLALGYVLAAGKKDAFAAVDHPDAEVFEADTVMPWPGHVGECLVWVTRPLPPEMGNNRRCSRHLVAQEDERNLRNKVRRGGGRNV